MQRAGSKKVFHIADRIDLVVAVHHMGDISRGGKVQHLLQLGKDCFITPELLQEVLDWYNANDAAGERQENENEPMESE
jgi:hypothetical protein